jgi:hypothetical protein
MKKLLTITLLSAAMAVSGQSKKDISDKYQVFDTSGTRRLTEFIGTSATIISNKFDMIQSTLPPTTITFQNGPKPILVINLKKDGKNVGLSPDWDIMEIRLSKNNFYWLNDSTAIFIKPKK